MTDLLTSFYKSALERLRPLVTLPRVLYFVLLVLIAAPNADEIFSFSTLQRPVGEISTLTIAAFRAIPLWLFTTILLLVFVAAPYLCFFLIRAFIAVFHIKRSVDLIQTLEDTLESTDEEIAHMQSDQVTALYRRKRKGLERLGRYNTLAEACTYIFVMTMTAFILDSVSIALLITFVACCAVILYYITRRMLICFLVEIKTYDVVAQRRAKFEATHE